MYIVIPRPAVPNPVVELDHVEQCRVDTNNLKLNRAKSTEIIFSSSRHKGVDCHHTELSDISHITTVTVTNHLPVSEHVSGVINKCAQSFHTLKILRGHGMSDDALTVVQSQ